MSRLSQCILVGGLLLLGACENAPTGAPQSQPQPTAPPVAFTAVPVPGGIVSWLPGDGTTDDIVGTNDGTLVNGASYGTGVVGQAFLLDESQDQYVNLGNDPSLHLSAGGDFSMEAWVKFNSLSDDMSILDKMAAPTGVNSDGWRLLKQRDQRIWFCLGGGSNTCGVPTHTLFSLSTVSTGTWYHVAAVVDATSGTFSLYVDGALQDTEPLPAYTDTNSSDLRLGFYASEGFSDMDGFIDEATFYGSALTGAQVQAIYNAGSDGKEKEEPNSPPQIGADDASVAVDEGQTASNTGTLSDADGDVVGLSASVGSIVNENDGTWSWSFDTTDGPAESQTVTIDADDGNGGTAQTSFTLTVDNVAPTIASVALPTEPVAIGDQPVSASGTFSDPAGPADETYACTVDYGDGSGPLAGTISAGTTCTGPGHTYAGAGVYQVTVTVVDKDGGAASLAAETFLVIYDPSGGFVTGGGWIDSPPGAYAADPMLTGKANFGFVSKYRKGANVPTGNTEFQFKAGDLNFRSSSYDWLVVNQGGTNAQFKGSGTVNGAVAPTGADYRFMIWAGDDDPDDFRIKIWHDDGGASSTFDATADFDASLAPSGAGGTNPNGVWTYGATSGLFGAFTPFPDLAEPAPVNCSVGDMWLDLATHAGYTPSVARTRAACFDGNVAFDAGQLILHGGAPDRYAHVVFTAPAELTCTVSADFTSRQNGVSADVHVVHQGSALFSDNVVGGPGTQASYSDIVTLAAGDALSFAVGLGTPPQSLHAGNVQLEAVLECGGGEVVVYDNGFGQELGGGSIVIHTRK